MKKTLSLTLALLLVLALAIPVWADTVDPKDLPSVSAGDDISGEVVDNDDVYVEVIPADMSKVDNDQLKEAAAEELSDMGVTAEDVVAIEVIDIVLRDKETDEILDPEQYGGEDIVIAFVHDDVTKELITVFYLDPADNTWKPLPFTITESGKVIVTVNELYELAFAVSEVSPAPPTPTPTTPGGKTSPETGYSTALWSVLGAVSLLCAGLFFAVAGKKSRS